MTGREKGTHIIVGSYEYDRVMEPLFGEYPIKRMVVFKGVESSYSKMSELSDEFIERIRKNVPRSIETITVNLYNFEEVFQETLQTFRKYSDGDAPIYLNISSAPKLALVAMISAAYFFREKANIEIFYVAPERYLLPDILEELENLNGDNKGALENLKSLRDEYSNSGVAAGSESYEIIPLFPIEKINNLDREILWVLAENGSVGSISELVEELQKASEEEVKRTSVQYRLKKLEEKNLIASSRVERRMEIMITRLGEIYHESTRGGLDL